jgi:hypothetical protein
MERADDVINTSITGISHKKRQNFTLIIYMHEITQLFRNEIFFSKDSSVMDSNNAHSRMDK